MGVGKYPNVVACFFPAEVVGCCFRFYYRHPPKVKSGYDEIFPLPHINYFLIYGPTTLKKGDVDAWCLGILDVSAIRF